MAQITLGGLTTLNTGTQLDPMFAELYGTQNAVAATRSAPHANFAWFTADFGLPWCAGPGRAGVSKDIADVFMTKYGGTMSSVVKFVATAAQGGSDANNGDSWATPYLTIDKALRTVTCGTIYVWPGTYDRPSYRYNDTSGTLAKRVIAPFQNVTIADPGDSLSAATWTANGTYPNVWQTTLTTTNWPIRVLLSTLMDAAGLPTPLPKLSTNGAATATGLAAVNAGFFGWWYDTGTKILYVRKGNENVNTVTKPSLSAVYATGGDNSVLLYSSTSYWEGINFLAYPFILKQAGQAAPEGWFKNCNFRYAESNSINLQGGGCYIQGCTGYRSAADHGNYNTASGTTAYAAEINYTTMFAGDVDTFGSGASQPNNPISTATNKNGTSNHDGYVVRINGSHSSTYGPPIADTATSYSWCLGVSTGYSYSASGGGQRIGFLMQGNNAWIDGCTGGPGQDFAFNSDSSAAVRMFNSPGSQSATSSGGFAAYVPS